VVAKSRPQDDKHPYASPTTAGLYITFRDLVIELVCLNVNRSIGARFWQDAKYWGPKYKREIRGVSNLSKKIDLEDKINQTALLWVIKNKGIKSLSATKTIERIVYYTKKQRQKLTEEREQLSAKKQIEPIDNKKNSVFVESGKKTTFAKIREAENG